MQDGDAWFEFFLAHELHVTVGELRARTSQREFLQWRAWFQLKWEREQRASLRASRRR